ncbi:hypothetical protein ABZP36_033958 [Zizania latifolia]
MDSCLLSGLNPSAAPFEPVTHVRAEYPCLPALPPPATFLPTQCLYPRPPPPVFAGLVASSCLCGGGFGTKGCTCPPFVQVGVPAFPHAWWVRPALPPPPPPPLMVYWSYQALPPSAASTTRCRITEIEEGRSDEEARKVEAGTEPCPRSLLTPRRKAVAPLRKTRRVAHPPPPRASEFAATTVMIRNIPNKFMKGRLMAILDQHCAEENGKLRSRGGGCTVAKSEYDFFYVPVDFRTHCNKGYAFVNMTTAIAARRLRNFLQNHRWDASSSGKVCDVVPATIQGREALVLHFSASRFPCPTKSLLPVWFEPPRDGARKTAAHVVGSLVDRRR